MGCQGSGSETREQRLRTVPWFTPCVAKGNRVISFGEPKFSAAIRAESGNGPESVMIQ